jgi:hypothetical protein
MEKLNEEYQTKFDFMIHRIPDTMYIFEVTKLCGYGEFMFIYKNMPLSDLYKSVFGCFGNSNANGLFFMNPETKIRYPIPKSDFFSIRDLITKFQNDPEIRSVIKPLYPLPANIVYKIYYDDGHVHATCCA